MEISNLSCYNRRGVDEIITKYREKPIKIAGYEAMLKRLPRNHEKWSVFQDLLNSANAGFGGEKRLDRLLKHFDPPYPYLLIQDLSLSEAEECQIDTVLITQSCIFLLEVKNMGGRLRFSENPSVLHQSAANGKNRTYKSPVVQVETAKLKISKILKAMEIALPVKSAIVIAYPNQVVEDVPPGATVWSADEVMIRLHNLDVTKIHISLEQMKAFGEHLLSIEEVYKPFPLAPKFEIDLKAIENGVFCPRCRLRKMERAKRTWYCKICRISSTDAHLQALDEWFMLMKPTITTTECRDFLGLTNLDAAIRVLKRNTLIETGSRRYRQYTDNKENVL